MSMSAYYADSQVAAQRILELFDDELINSRLPTEMVEDGLRILSIIADGWVPPVKELSLIDGSFSKLFVVSIEGKCVERAKLRQRILALARQLDVMFNITYAPLDRLIPPFAFFRYRLGYSWDNATITDKVGRACFTNIHSPDKFDSRWLTPARLVFNLENDLANAICLATDSERYFVRQLRNWPHFWRVVLWPRLRTGAIEALPAVLGA